LQVIDLTLQRTVGICRANENCAAQIKARASRERAGVHLIKNACRGRKAERKGKHMAESRFVCSEDGGRCPARGVQRRPCSPRKHRAPLPMLLRLVSGQTALQASGLAAQHLLLKPGTLLVSLRGYRTAYKANTSRVCILACK